MSGFRQFFIACLVIAGLLVPNAAQAVKPDEVLKDPVLEGRARSLSALLRCLVCQNQSIDDSNATLARDLRLLVRERLVKGDTDDQVLEYLVARYGEFVLLKPRFSPSTYILWIAPGVLFVIGVYGVVLLMRRRVAMAKASGPTPLSGAEERELEELLKQ